MVLLIKSRFVERNLHILHEISIKLRSLFLPINWNLLQWIPGSVTLRNSGEQSICKLGTHHRNLLPNAFLQTLPEVSEV